MKREQIELSEIVAMMNDCFKLLRMGGLDKPQSDAVKILEHGMKDLIAALVHVSSRLGDSVHNGIVIDDKISILKKDKNSDNYDN